MNMGPGGDEILSLFTVYDYCMGLDAELALVQIKMLHDDDAWGWGIDNASISNSYDLPL
jgi:hypothetical protein